MVQIIEISTVIKSCMEKHRILDIYHNSNYLHTTLQVIRDKERSRNFIAVYRVDHQ